MTIETVPTTSKKWCCTQCGGTEVYFDAFVGVNEPQDVMTFDATHCMTCEGECGIEEREVSE